MLVQNFRSQKQIPCTEFSHGCWNWDVTANEESLAIVFERMLIAQTRVFDHEGLVSNILEEDVDTSLKIFSKHEASHGKSPFETTLRYQLKDGSVMYVLCKGMIVTWHNDKPLRMTGCMMDITKIINGENELKKESEFEKRQNLLDEVSKLAKLGIWEADIVHKKIFWSKGMYDIHELPYDFIPSFENLKKFHATEEEYNGLLEPFKKCVEEGRDFYEFTAPITTLTGKKRWVHITGSPLKDINDNIIGAKGLAQDVTESEMKARILKRYQAELERNEFLLNETGNMAKVGGWEFDLNTGTVVWTSQVYEINEVPTNVIPDYDLVKNACAAEYKDLLANAVNECIAQQKEYDFELVMLTPAGKRKWVRAIGKPVTDENGKVVMLRGTVQDIDEKKKKEIEAQKSLNIINSQNERLKNYAHVVSHNLRTHSGNIETLLRMIEETEDDETKKMLMEHLHKVSQGLNETITHLNDVAQIQKDIQAATINISFKEMLEKTIDVLMPVINETGASITHDFSQLKSIEYIPAYIESIMLNFLSNSLKYKHAERRPEITVKTFVQDNKNFLQVTDNGLGIDLARHKEKLFGMYRTFHKHPDARGIGLFITKNQVEALGGNIDVSSERGVGSTFTVQF